MRSPRGVAVAVFAILGAAVSLSRLWSGALFPPLKSDFLTFYVSAALVRDGAPPYDIDGQMALHTAIIGSPPERPSSHLSFLPPAYLVALVPVTLLSPEHATALWTVMLLATLGICAIRLGSTLPMRARLAMLAWVFAWNPCALALRLGQLTPLLLLAFIGLATAVRQRRELTAGLCLAVLSVKPPLAVAPVLLLLVLRRWKALGSAALVVGALTAGAALWRPSVIAEYIGAMHYAAGLQATDDVWRSATYSLAVLAQYFGSRETWALTLMGAGVLCVWGGVLRLRGTTDAVAALPLVGLLVNPHVLFYDVALTLGIIPAFARRAGLGPLLLAGLALPPVAHNWLRLPGIVTAWMVAALLFILLVPPLRYRATDTMAGPASPRTR